MYFSVKSFCCSSSAKAKNSSISPEVEISCYTEIRVFRSDANKLEGLLVLEPGVSMLSDPFIKLEGVLSLVLLLVHAKN